MEGASKTDPKLSRKAFLAMKERIESGLKARNELVRSISEAKEAWLEIPGDTVYEFYHWIALEDLGSFNDPTCRVQYHYSSDLEQFRQMGSKLEKEEGDSSLREAIESLEKHRDTRHILKGGEPARKNDSLQQVSQERREISLLSGDI